MFRRGVIPGLLLVCAGFVSAGLPLAAYAAATGVRGLDTPAIVVKDPASVVLIAVANAGGRLVAVGEHGVIIYSDDNGQIWRQSTVPVDVTLTAVAFANPREGWAVGHEGVILRTSDGGATWRLQLNGLTVNRADMAVAQAAVAANDPAPGTPRALIRANHFLQAGPEVPFLAVLVADSKTVLAFGAYRMAEETADDGKDWADWTLHVGDPISHNLYDVTRVGSDIYLAGEAGDVLRSTDGGSSFVAVSVPAPDTMFVIRPTGDGGIFVCGVAGEAFRSDDHGASWQPVSFDTQSNLTSGYVLASGAIVVGSEAGSLYVSHDHARTFSMLPQVQPMEIFGMTQAANGDIVLVGSSGVLLLQAKLF